MALVTHIPMLPRSRLLSCIVAIYPIEGSVPGYPVSINFERGSYSW